MVPGLLETQLAALDLSSAVLGRVLLQVAQARPRVALVEQPALVELSLPHRALVELHRVCRVRLL